MKSMFVWPSRTVAKSMSGEPRRRTSAKQSGEFGFLEAADGHEVYFHRNSVLDGAYNRLAVGTHVAFAEEMGEKGPQASTVKLLGKHRLRV